MSLNEIDGITNKIQAVFLPPPKIENSGNLNVELKTE